MYCGPAIVGTAFATPAPMPTAARAVPVETNIAAATYFRLITLNPLGNLSYGARRRTAWRAPSAKEVGIAHLPASGDHYNARPKRPPALPLCPSAAEFAAA